MRPAERLAVRTLAALAALPLAALPAGAEPRPQNVSPPPYAPPAPPPHGPAYPQPAYPQPAYPQQVYPGPPQASLWPQAPAPFSPASPDVIAPWNPEAPPKPGYELRSSVDRGLVGGGAAMLVGLWAVSAITAVAASTQEARDGLDGDGIEEDDWAPLYIPVVGPILAIPSLGPSASGTTLLVLDGVLQAFGGFMIGWGIVDRDYRLVRSPAARAGLRLEPRVGPGSVGMRGEF